jgi:hypothetical protein
MLRRILEFLRNLPRPTSQRPVDDRDPGRCPVRDYWPDDDPPPPSVVAIARRMFSLEFIRRVIQERNQLGRGGLDALRGDFVGFLRRRMESDNPNRRNGGRPAR